LRSAEYRHRLGRSCDDELQLVRADRQPHG
jgi:hypothetical protein